jgi:hypothetical protein
MKKRFLLLLAGFAGIVYLLCFGIPDQIFRRPFASPSSKQVNSVNPGMRPLEKCATPSKFGIPPREGNCERGISIPMTFEQNIGQAGRRVEFVGRGKGFVVLLTRQGIEIPAASEVHAPKNAAAQSAPRAASAGVVRWFPHQVPSLWDRRRRSGLRNFSRRLGIGQSPRRGGWPGVACHCLCDRNNAIKQFSNEWRKCRFSSGPEGNCEFFERVLHGSRRRHDGQNIFALFDLPGRLAERYRPRIKVFRCKRSLCGREDNVVGFPLAG